MSQLQSRNKKHKFISNFAFQFIKKTEMGNFSYTDCNATKCLDLLKPVENFNKFSIINADWNIEFFFKLLS